MTIGIAFLIMLIDAAAYYFGSNKIAEMGRIAFFCGLFIVLSGAAEVVALIR